jgi:hypothetical protein
MKVRPLSMKMTAAPHARQSTTFYRCGSPAAAIFEERGTALL